MFGNRLQVPVTRSGRRLGGLARHRIRTRWHDDRGFGMTGSDRAVDAVLVVCAIAGERGDGTMNLVEQGTDLRAVIDIIGGQYRGDDPPRVGIDADVQFTPRPAPAGAVLFDQPFTGAGQCVFAERQVIPTIYAVGMALERNPQAAETMARQGCDIVDHGWRWLDYHGIDEATEREHIRLSVKTIRRLTGTRPIGWYIGTPSANRRR